ncbi:MAG: serine protease [Oscillospiraceae bacterium]|jgi:segregation and condensation protein A|nr:serine protease [Oscillospiraceae bacterium]
MTQLSFRLSDFEGPLDLLLHLIAKHKLDILNIEISELLQQYMTFIENRENRDLEVASEFLEMAARLVHIKTVMLLPRHEEEADDLKNRLTGELMEYQLCKLAANQLSVMAEENRLYVRAPMALETDLTYQLTHPASILLEAAGVATGRAVRRQALRPAVFSNIVKRRVVSVSSRIIHLMRKLYRNPDSQFSALFEDQRDRSELVATFLAVLELIKGGRITISPDGEMVRFHRAAKTAEQEVPV